MPMANRVSPMRLRMIPTSMPLVSNSAHRLNIDL
jgi:hypothetical protein